MGQQGQRCSSTHPILRGPGVAWPLGCLAEGKGGSVCSLPSRPSSQPWRPQGTLQWPRGPHTTVQAGDPVVTERWWNRGAITAVKFRTCPSPQKEARPHTQTLSPGPRCPCLSLHSPVLHCSVAGHALWLRASGSPEHEVLGFLHALAVARVTPQVCVGHAPCGRLPIQVVAGCSCCWAVASCRCEQGGSAGECCFVLGRRLRVALLGQVVTPC